MSYKFNPCVPCPCEGVTPPKVCTEPLNASLAFHLNIYFGMQTVKLYTRFTFGPDVPADHPFRQLNALPDVPFGAIGVGLAGKGFVLFGTDADHYLRAVRADGFNIAITLRPGHTVPNPAFPYEILRTVDRLSITKGPDAVTYTFDAATGKLVFDQANSTVNVCLTQTAMVTWIGARIYDVASAPLRHLKLTETFFGFGGRPACVNANFGPVTIFDNALGNIVDNWAFGSFGGVAFPLPLLPRRFAGLYLPGQELILSGLTANHFFYGVPPNFITPSPAFEPLATPIMSNVGDLADAGLPVIVPDARIRWQIGYDKHRSARDPLTFGDYTKAAYSTIPGDNAAFGCPGGAFTLNELLT